jgi:hypothetical protein
VHRDFHVEIGRALYSVPKGFLGQERVRWSVYGVAAETGVTDVIPGLGEENRDVNTDELSAGGVGPVRRWAAAVAG